MELERPFLPFLPVKRPFLSLSRRVERPFLPLSRRVERPFLRLSRCVVLLRSQWTRHRRRQRRGRAMRRC